ncbi:MAG: hypothetical protein SFT94_00805 [Pseudanabaenaceae cyanobacterium bins.68]|nr:hypothetical protein [Pseudanabaenaceae cyanobacterium bins.68]
MSEPHPDPKIKLEVVQPNKLSHMPATDQKPPTNLGASAAKLHNQKVMENLIFIAVLLLFAFSLPIFLWQQITSNHEEKQRLDQMQRNVSSSAEEVKKLQEQLSQSFGIGRDQEDNIRKAGAHKPNEIPIKSQVQP